MFPDTTVYLTKKNQTTYCYCKRQFLSKWCIFNLNCTINYLTQAVYHLRSKHTSTSKHNTCSLSGLHETKMLIKTTLSVPSWKQGCLWLHQSKLSLFHPFLLSSKLDHKTCPVLLWVIEAGMYEGTSFSLLKDRSQLARILPLATLLAKQFEECQDFSSTR